MFEIHGNTQGIRKTELAKLQSLYLTELGPEEFLTADLAYALAAMTALLDREIAVYLSRSGEVIDIVIGEVDTVELPEYRMRRRMNALSRVRVIHTHPSGSAKLSALDLTALSSLMLDAICALGICQDGSINGVSAAFITGMTDGIPQIEESGIYSLSSIARLHWMRKISDCDQNTVSVNATTPARERAILIAIRDDRSFDELGELARTAGAEPVGSIIQKRPAPDPSTYIGSGKVRELALSAQTLGADLIIAQDELTGAQIHHLESMTGTRVIDRTTLILDIFAQRARTREGQLQVSLAQLNYQITHVIGFGLSLSRLGGGIGTRGPGETKLEMDRRIIKKRRTQLREQIVQLKKQRALQKQLRTRNSIPTAALVGYTNAGKSTIFNALTGEQVYVENQLFATLDATTRRIDFHSAAPFLLTDTVGFISHLPTDLIEAFQSTLEEAVSVDLLLIVTDASDPNALSQRAVVSETLEKLGVSNKPLIEILNKCDRALQDNLLAFPDAVRISAKNGDGIGALKKEISQRLADRSRCVRFAVPYSAMNITAMIHEASQNVVTEYTDEAVVMTADISQTALDQLLKAAGPALHCEMDSSSSTEEISTVDPQGSTIVG